MIAIHRSFRLLAALLALALLALPAALAEAGVQAVVSVDSMGVYAVDAPHDCLGALPKGTAVTVQAVSGGAALISWNGKTGVVRAADLRSAASDAAADDDAGTPVVTTRDTRVYSRASTSSRYATVKAGTALRLLAVNGGCARVSRNGRVGYVDYSALGQPGDSADGTAANGEAAQAAAADTPVKTGNLAVVTTRQSRVYAGADTSGAFVTLRQGTKLTLLAVRGDVAMVEKDGAIGYLAVADLKKDDGSAAAQVKLAANPFSQGSAEHTIYAFLTGELGLNRAAAMGILSNIRHESSYNPACSGDGGTSYGICQWHAGRKTNLINWCTENGLDYTALDAQLGFLKYELSTRYPSVLSYLRQVENTAEGAYDAGYYFCFNFEAPAARTSQSTRRAAYARDTLFPM